jgi:hypothetical protein
VQTEGQGVARMRIQGAATPRWVRTLTRLAHTRTYLRRGAGDVADARPRRILSVFSGPARPADGFATLAALSGFHVDEIDVLRGGPSSKRLRDCEVTWLGVSNAPKVSF